MDQAIALREKASGLYDGRQAPQPGKSVPIHVVSFTSGKGGVGKTNIVVNTAMALAEKGLKVMIFDADLGLANVDVILGLTPRYNIRHVLTGQRTLSEVVVDGPGGIRILPAASGLDELTALSEGERLNLLSHFENYDGDIDILLIDTGAGIGRNVMYFNSAANQIVVVATPEPTSITDAYALIKVLYTRHGQKDFTLLVNSVRNETAAKAVYQNLAGVSEKFLSISLDYAGFIPKDANLGRSVARQKPLMEINPNSPACTGFRNMAETIVRQRKVEQMKGTLQFCWSRLLVRN